MNLTPNQILAIIAAVISALVAASTQLTDIFGPTLAKSIVSGASLVSVILNSIIAGLTGQGAQIKQVLAMPGIEKITVNAQANQTLSAIAIDPSVNKISPTPAAQDDVTKKATNT